MALPITFNNQQYAAGFFGTDDGAASAAFNIDDTYTYPVTLNGTVTKAGDTVTLSYTPTGGAPTTKTLTATVYDNPTMIEFTGTGLPGGDNTGAYRFVFSNSMIYGSSPPAGQTRTRFTADGNGAVGDYATPVCFASGTRILAVRDGIEGEIAVEELRVGDLAVTASGARRPIRWIGRRAYSGVFASRNPDVLPVRFAAGSLGDNLPARDLVVSPKHAMVLDGTLVPAETLVNGRTITKAARIESVEYFHVELDSHDVLIAEGAESESYVEDDNRNFFHNAPDYRAANPDAVVREAVYCLPRIEEGYALEVIRQRLARRAGDLGVALSTTLQETARAA